MIRAASPPPSGQRRRWRVRVVVYSLLGLFALIVLALRIAAGSGAIEARLKAQIESSLRDTFGQNVTVEAATIDWLPPGVTIEGVAAEDGRLAIPRVSVALSLRALLSGHAVIRDVHVENPVVRWDLDAGPFLPPRPPRSPEEGPSRVTLERLGVENGTVWIGSERRTFSAVFEGLSVIVTGAGGAGPTGPWEGTLHFRRGDVRAGPVALAGSEGVVIVTARGDSIETRHVRVRAEGFDMESRGSIHRPDRRGTFTILSFLDPSAPGLERPAPALSAGSIQAELALTLQGASWEIEGTWSAEAPSWDPDRQEESNGPRPALSARGARGRLRVVPGTMEMDGTMEGVGGGSVAIEVASRWDGDSPGEAESRLRGSFEGVDPAPVLAPFDLPGRDDAIPSTRASGEFTLQWHGAALRKGDGTADLRFDRSPGAVPLWGTAAVSWHGPKFTIRHAALETQGTAIDLSGTFDTAVEPARIDLACHLDADDTVALIALVERRFPVAPRGGAPDPLLRPSDARGRLSARLRVTGTTRSPRLEAEVGSDWMTVSLPVFGEPHRRLPVALDGLEGTLLYDAPRLHVHVARASGEGLEIEGDFEMDTALDAIRALRLDARAFPASLAAGLAGLDPERMAFDGTIRGACDLTRGPTGALEGPVDIGAERVTAGPVETTDVHVRGALRSDRVEIHEGTMATFGGRISATGEVPTSSTGRGVLSISTLDLDLARIDAAFGGPAYEGTVDVETRLAFDDGVIGVDGMVSGHDLRIGEVPFGTVSGPMGGTATRLRVSVADASGTPSLQALIVTEGGEPMVEATMRAERFSLERIRPVLPPDALPGLRGDADGEITVRGPLFTPELIEARAVLDRINLTAGDYPLHNEGTVRLTLSEGFATLAPMRLVGEKTDMRIGGSFKLAGEHELSAHVTGGFDLGLLEIVLPSARASGPGRADIQVIERGEGMTWSGTVSIDGGRIAHPSLPLPLLNLQGQGRFEEKGLLVIDEIACTMGGGKVSGTGSVRFQGSRLPEGRLDLQGRGITSEIVMPGLRAYFDADTAVTLEEGIYRATGRIVIQRAVYSRPFGVDTGELLLRSREFGPARDRRNGGPVVLLDLDVIADGGIWVRNDDARIEAEADLSLRGTLDNPELSGNLSAFEGGTYRFRDVTYRIVTGSLDFVTVDRIDPRLNIEAVSRVRNYEVTLRITGTISKPVYDLTSDPALTQPEIVWLLITGQDPADPSYGATQFTQAEVAGYLAAPVAEAVTSPLTKIPGVTRVRIDPYFLEGTADPSARATVTSRISESLQFTYSTSLDKEAGDVYQVEYNRGRLWDFIGTRDEDGSVGGDVRFRRRWRGRNPFSRNMEETSDTSWPLMRVGTLSIVADRLVDSEKKLLSRVPVREGGALHRGDLLEGRENLRIWYARHGFPTAEVDVVEEDPESPDAVTRDVTYVIRAGPRHSLHVQSDIDPKWIRRQVLDAWEDTLLFDDLLDAARQATFKALWERGHHAASVEVSVDEAEEGRRIVNLDVAAGPKVKVAGITIQGNLGIPEDRIRRQLLTHGTLRRSVLDEDLLAIRALYMSQGYLSVHVHDPEIVLDDDGTEARITITLEEGTRWIIDSVAIEDVTAGVPGESLIAATGLVQGQPLVVGALGDAAEHVRLELDRQGYPDARVDTTLQGPPEATRIVFSCHPGERARIASVRIEGNTRTRDRIIEREITLEPGDPLSRAAMLQTQANLYRLGVFRTVRVEPTPAGDDPVLKDVTITVREGAPILTGWAVGYDSEDRLRGSIEVGHNNLFGSRRSAALFLRGSAVDSRVQLTLRDPNLFGEKIESLWSAFLEEREFESFDEDRLGISAQLQRPLSDHVRIFGNYRLEDVNLSNLQISEEEAGVNDVRLGSFALSGVHDSRDDIVNPARGSLSSLDLRLYAEPLGSDETFMRYLGRYSRFQNLGHRVVWAWSVRAGLMTSEVPTSERFYAGGDTSVRGFDRDTLGPKDPNSGNPVGGNVIFILNQELRFPIWRFLNGVVFYDVGNVWEDADAFDIWESRDVLGAGFRFSTPIGPLRLEYGHKLDREEGESPGRFFFSIGQAF